MKIIDGIKLKGAPVEIADCGRDDLAEFFSAMGYKTGAEIGVYQGKFTRDLAKTGLKIYGIDPWRPYKDFDIEDENRKERQETLYREATKRLAGYPNITLIRKTSMEALEDFKDESLDFVYIDGNHRFKYVADDICEWSRKIRKGGVVSGHDYIHPERMTGRWDNLQVKFVVDAYIQAFRIKDWYLLGEGVQKPGEKRDRFRSWMWIKT